MAHGLLLTIPEARPFLSFSEQTLMPYWSGLQTLLEQYQLDHNVQTLLRAVHDAFDFAHHEDTLKSIKPKSEQARILTLMLQDVGSCCDFIQSYAGNDSEFCASSSSFSLVFVNMLFSGKRTLKNIGDGPEEKIKDLSDVLVKRRTAFLDQATISTQITAFQILDSVVQISTLLSNVGR
jgi:hypothetical protein